MAALSDRELDAISDSISLRVLAVLDKHKKEMHESNRVARESTFEAGTGYSWEKRHIVRDTIKYATDRRDTHNRRRVAFWGMATALGLSQAWEYIVSFFHKG